MTSADTPQSSLSVDEALARVLDAVRPLPATGMSLDDALGLVLAEDVVATCDLPPFDNSAMDGFALRAADTAGARPNAPVTLRVSGEIAAGHASSGVLDAGCALRIMTGAPVPKGADAVERVEYTEALAASDGTNLVRLRRPVTAGSNIRPAGEDARRGAVVLRAGTRLHPGAIGLLAATGRARIVAHRRPRVGVLVTGDEIVRPGDPLEPGRIWNSNGPMVAAQIRQCGGEPVSLGVAEDAAESIRAALTGSGPLDLLITTGGISVGAYDILKDVLHAEGQLKLWSVRIRPGKPLALGRIGDTQVLGLPGNPVAAAVAFWQFGRAAVLRMQGRADVRLPEIQARLECRIENRGGRRNFVRVALSPAPDGYVARPCGRQGSAILTSLAAADGLLVIPEDCEVAEPGMTFPVQLLTRDGG